MMEQLESHLRGKAKLPQNGISEPQLSGLIDLFFILFKRQLNVKGLFLCSTRELVVKQPLLIQ